MKLLEDIVAAHKSLCEAVLEASKKDVSSGFSDPAKSLPSNASKSLQSSADSPYLSEDEENQIAQQLGLDQTSQFMDKLVERQFHDLHVQRAAQASNAPQPISAQSRPRMIVPEYELSSTPPPMPEQHAVPEAVEEEVPEHIRMADFMTKKKMTEPERPAGRSKPLAANDIMEDFSTFMSRGG